MVKEGIKRTAIMLGVYLLCVGSVLSILIYNFKTFETDYTEDVQGSWISLQHFKNKTLYPHSEEEQFVVTVDGDSFTCTFRNGDAPLSGTFAWKNGYSGTVTASNGFTSFVSIETNSRGDLQLRVVEAEMVLLLGRTEATS